MRSENQAAKKGKRRKEEKKGREKERTENNDDQFRPVLSRYLLRDAVKPSEQSILTSQP